MELSGMTTFQNFDGLGRPNRPGDNMLLLTTGLSFSIGKTGWKRVVDAGPYMRMNEQLVGYANSLSAENHYYAGKNEKNKRTLIELKKVMEIEGLLDKYSHLFADSSEHAGHTYPVNNYSGLNSLLARLKNKKWNGKSVDESSSQVPVTDPEDSLCSNGNNTQGLCAAEELEPKYFSEVDSTYKKKYADCFSNGIIGSPVYFFFNLNSVQLTDRPQSINLDALARVAVKYDLYVKVTGAADKETGTFVINDSLSLTRANYISDQLQCRGVKAEKIVVDSKGGISDYLPVEANRNTKVELFAPDIEREAGMLEK